MDLSSVNSFTAQTDKRVTEIRRDAFSVDGVRWRYIRRDRQGNVLYSFSVLESTAQIALQKALQLQHDRPDLVRVEIEKLSYTRELQEKLRENPFPYFPLHY